ncbi:hypothetical protein DSO57_1003201 [Entomophthora muscae]|uniref:Uncharacterized protein n=1 Tax=Entomophthora muscae TaxID=34485 RepID=A0ACC2RZN2_9FUNG|nr:hypothetical protein DSO57_1003201 [Entomophthora muscae]
MIRGYVDKIREVYRESNLAGKGRMEELIQGITTISLGNNTRQTSYVKSLMAWLEKEKEEEAKQVEREDACVKHLVISCSETGLGGHTEVYLEREDGLPKHTLKVGDTVKLVPERKGLVGEKRGCEDGDDLLGFVKEINKDSILIGLDDLYLSLENLNTAWTITKDNNKVVFKWIGSVLELVEDYCLGVKLPQSAWPGDSDLISLMLTSSPEKPKFNHQPIIGFHDQKLDASQMEAVRHCVAAHDVALIHGPPGTGKTRALVELVRRLVQDGNKVLVCGPSNTSVDNLLERISKTSVSCLWIGNADRLKLQSLRPFLIDTKIKEDINIHAIRKRMDKLRDAIIRCRFDADRQEMHAELRELKKRLFLEEKHVIEKLLKEHDAIFSTLSGVGSRILQEQAFNVLVIDEATQAIEPECWVAISHADKVIFTGDHHQLPPVVLTQNSILENTIFERLLNTFDYTSYMLKTQYRMHQSIVGFSNAQFYENKLSSDELCKLHLLIDLPQVINSRIAKLPLVFINTAGKSLYESPGAKSKSNSFEAVLVVYHLKTLLKLGLDPSDIAIISPTMPKSTF